MVTVVIYKIGPWLFDHDRSVLISEDIEKELDPLSFNLLAYFIKQNQRIVTREELIEHVWQRNFVDDNAINRAISELRKQLKHMNNEKALIKTHYRKGYSLTVNVIVLPKGSENPPFLQNEIVGNIPSHSELKNNVLVDETLVPQVDDVKEVKRTHKNITGKVLLNKWLLAFIIIIFACVLGIFILDKKPINNSSDIYGAKDFKVSSATWNVGTEYNPLVSFDRQYFSYGNFVNDVDKTFVKRIADQHQKELKYQGMQVVALSWQPEQHALLTLLRSAENKKCLYGLFDLSQFPKIPPPIIVKSCQSSSHMSAQLSADGKTLYYNQFSNVHEGAAIYQYKLQQKKQSLLLPHSEAGKGAQDIKLSPNGKYIAYIWSNKKNPAQIYLLNLQTNENKLIHQFIHSVNTLAFDWSIDNKNIILAEENKLYKIDIHNKNQIITTFSENYEEPYDLAVEQDKQVLVLPKGLTQLELLQVKNLFNDAIPIFKPIHRSDKKNYAPELSPYDTSKLFFASNRSGSHQIWQFYRGNLKQLSFLENSTNLLSLVKPSHNGNYLSFIHGKNIKLINLNSNELNDISELPKGISSYAWSVSDDSIIYIKEIDNTQQIWEFNLLTRKNTLVSETGGESLIDDGQGMIYFFNNDYLINLFSNKKHKLPFKRYDNSVTAITANYLYLSHLTTLYRLNLKTGIVNQAELSFTIESFTVMPDDSDIILTKIKIKTGQIIRISWQ